MSKTFHIYPMQIEQGVSIISADAMEVRNVGFYPTVMLEFRRGDRVVAMFRLEEVYSAVEAKELDEELKYEAAK